MRTPGNVPRRAYEIVDAITTLIRVLHRSLVMSMVQGEDSAFSHRMAEEEIFLRRTSNHLLPSVGTEPASLLSLRYP